jgi:hypothetical protein
MWLLLELSASSFIHHLDDNGIRSSETSVLTRATCRNITEDDILHSHSRETLNSFIALIGRAPHRNINVSPVRYELDFYIPEDGILYSQRCENLKSFASLIGWALKRDVIRLLGGENWGFISQKTAFFVVK